MADLDEIVQKILLEGDVEVLKSLSEIGEKGFETFKQVAEAAEAGTSKMELFGNVIGSVAIAIVGLVGTISAYVEAQDDAIQKTNFLAESFGATTAQIGGIEAAFSAAGVSTATFEQFAQRLVVTIARDWPTITESVRTSATQQDAAYDRIRSAMLRIVDAQNNLGNVSAQEGSKIAAANLRVEQTFTALQFSAARAASEAVRNYNGLRNAALSLESAEQRLAELQGRPVSDAEKKSLEIRQAQAAVDNARQAQIDARLKQQQSVAEAAQKQAAIEQAHSDAQLKRDTLLQEQTNARAKAELQLREAVTQRAEAEEKAAQQALKDIPNIAKSLTGITTGNKDAAKSIDISKVAVQDLIKGLILASSSGIAGKPPDGMKVMSDLSKLLANDTDHLIDAQQRLAIVQQLGQRSMSQTGAAAFELLHALERGPDFFKKFEDAAKSQFHTTDEAKKNVEHFKDALEELTFAIQTVNRNFAAAASPLFTDFLKAMEHSLTSSTGTLKLFVDGVSAIGQAIGSLIGTVQRLAEGIDHAFNAEHGRTMQVIIAGLIIAVGVFASAWLAIPAVIAVVVTALGYVMDHLDGIKKFYNDHKAAILGIVTTVGILIAAFFPWTTILAAIITTVGLLVTNWDKVKEAAAKAWEYVKDTTVYKFLEGVIERAKQAYNWLEKVGLVGNAKGTRAAGDGAATTSDTTPPKSYATGGEVHGPGTSTSDSIFARLSAGEFVVKADAVAAYGASFFHSLNAMQFPGFASGGLVAAPQRLSGGGSVAPTSVLNLSIDGQSFTGLRGPKNVVDSLASFAVGRQTATAGRTPSWNK